MANALVAIAIVVGTSVVPIQAFGQQKAPEPPKKLEVDVEVWPISEAFLKELQSEEYNSESCAQLFRFSLIASASELMKSSKEPQTKIELPARSSLKITDGETHRLQMEIATSVVLELELRTAIVDDRLAILDYAMKYRSEQREYQVSDKRELSLGDVAMQQIKFHAADGSERHAIVVLLPKLRNAAGFEIIDPMIKPTFIPATFVPRVGRFELKVAEGWTGCLWVNSMGPPIRMIRSTNIGKRAGLKDHDGHVRIEAFRAERPVLEVANADDGFIEVVALRSGVATLRTSVQGADGKSGNCELQIVVEADTTEIDHALKQVLPDSDIKVTSINDSVILTGTVATRAEHQVLLEVAERFFPKAISRVTVTADRTEPPGRNDEDPSRKRRRKSSDQEELRREVKSLRDDVRRLSELVEKLSEKAVP